MRTDGVDVKPGVPYKAKYDALHGALLEVVAWYDKKWPDLGDRPSAPPAAVTEVMGMIWTALDAAKHAPGAPDDEDKALDVLLEEAAKEGRGGLVVAVTGLRSKLRGLESRIERALAAEERRGYENEILALRDGIRGWHAKATEAEERAKCAEEGRRIIDEVADVVSTLAPKACGTLAERVRGALTAVRAAAPGVLECHCPLAGSIDHPRGYKGCAFEAKPLPTIQCPQCGGKGSIGDDLTAVMTCSMCGGRREIPSEARPVPFNVEVHATILDRERKLLQNISDLVSEKNELKRQIEAAERFLQHIRSWFDWSAPLPPPHTQQHAFALACRDIANALKGKK